MLCDNKAALFAYLVIVEVQFGYNFMPNIFTKVIHFMIYLKFSQVKDITCRIYENIYDMFNV